MRYEITQKMLAVGGDYSVRDESGREAYYFDGKLFSFGGKKVVVLDSQRKEVARIVKKVLTFRPTYHVRRNGIVAAAIRKRGLTLREQFVIDVAGSNDYKVVGDYVGHEYTISRGSVASARVSKRFFGSTDSYGVEILSGDPVLLLSTVVVIDMVNYTKLKS